MKDTGLVRDEWWPTFRRNKPSKRRHPLAKRHSVNFSQLECPAEPLREYRTSRSAVQIGILRYSN